MWAKVLEWVIKNVFSSPNRPDSVASADKAFQTAEKAYEMSEKAMSELLEYQEERMKMLRRLSEMETRLMHAESAEVRCLKRMETLESELKVIKGNCHDPRT